MLERPNICYIFEKLGVQGCQIYMTFPMCQSHSTRPHNAKKALYVIISGEIPELGEKTCTCSFLHVFFCSQCHPVPGHIWAKKVPHSLPSNTQKMPKMAEYGPKMAKNALWKIAVTLTFTLNRKKIAVYFLQIFTYSDRFRDMAFSS